jgi:hypothetical protein
MTLQQSTHHEPRDIDTTVILSATQFLDRIKSESSLAIEEISWIYWLVEVSQREELLASCFKDPAISDDRKSWIFQAAYFTDPDSKHYILLAIYLLREKQNDIIPAKLRRSYLPDIWDTRMAIENVMGVFWREPWRFTGTARTNIQTSLLWLMFRTSR